MDEKFDDKLPAEDVTDKESAVDGDALTETWKQPSQASPPSPPSPPDDLPEIPGHESLDFVGRGGMGLVLKARHKVLDRTVAIKIPLPGHLRDAADRERFLREARATAKLRHANICPVYEVGEAGGRPYISMAFIEGETLARSVEQRRPSAREAAEMVAQLARAVGYAHEHGVLHRDIKPSNVMVDAGSGQPVLMDFGLAKELAQENSQLTQAGQVVGTPAYMAPEQAAGQQERVDTHSDVYALGAVLYYLMCGRAPFSGSTGEVLHQVQADAPVPPRKLSPRVHRDLETICLKTMAKEPANRYPSAVALAEDLERFCAGESILARREPMVRKAWRAVRRRPITVALVVVMLAGLAVFGIYAVRARQIAQLRRSIQVCIEEHCSTQADVEHAESLIDQLVALAPDQAEAERRRLHQRFAASIEGAIRRPRLQENDVAQIEAELELLAARDPQRAAELHEQLRNRLPKWQPLFELAPPFADLDAAFDPAAVRASGKGLLSEGGVVLTRTACGNQVQLEAEFDAAWATAGRLGLLLGADPRRAERDRGYVFSLEVLPESRSPPNTSSTIGKTSDAATVPVEVQILRNKVLLRTEQLEIPPGTLRLTAGRQADQLTLHINQLPPVEFLDAFPLRDGESRVLALLWPEGVALRLLRASSRTQPAEPSPLERGDDLYARGEFLDALAEYQKQAIASPRGEFAREARVKQALCLIALKRSAEAAELLQRVAEEEGPRWPLVARCRLWAIRLDERALDEAYAIFQGLASRYAPEDLRPLVPAELTDSIIEPYRQRTAGINWYLYNPQLTRNIERSLAVQDFFAVTGASLELTRLYLCRAYHMAGDDRQAIKLARRLLDEQTTLQSSDKYRWLQLCELYSWLLRLQGDPQAALAELDRHLFDASGGYRRENAALLVERARVHAALKQWDEAEKDLDELARLAPVGTLEYAHYSGACLVQGFLLQRRGDLAAAREAWDRGAFRRAPEHDQLKLRRAEGVLHAVVLASLTDRFTAEDVDWLIERAGRRVAQGHGIPLSVVKGVVRVVMLDMTPGRVASIVQRAFDGPEGHAVARQLALRELSMDESARRVVAAVVVQTVDELVVEGELSPDQRDVFRTLAEDAYVAYYSGRLTNAQLLQLAPVWQGLTGPGGWKRLATSFDSPLRAALAYGLGHRYLRLNRQADAGTFFRLALDEAPPDSTLHRLVQTELEHLKADTPDTAP